MKEYFVYILQCADGSYYIGVTGNFEKRVHEHAVGYDPTSYTFSRRPISLVHLETFNDIREAIHREKQLQRWSRKKKQALIQGNLGQLQRYSKRKTRQGN